MINKDVNKFRKNKKYTFEWYHNKTYVFDSKDELLNFMYLNNFHEYYILGGEFDNKIYCRFGRYTKIKKIFNFILTKKRR